MEYGPEALRDYERSSPRCGNGLCSVWGELKHPGLSLFLLFVLYLNAFCPLPPPLAHFVFLDRLQVPNQTELREEIDILLIALVAEPEATVGCPGASQ